MSLGPAIAVSVVLLVLNAFFVAAEFAVVASKRHRLEERAAEGSRAARSAVKANSELSLMLAGSQLGITLCTLGLGALAEPAIAYAIEPWFTGLGLSPFVSHLIAVIIAVALVVFLHMVVGEMAPKSWAISHPETSATLLAIPFRGFTWVVRPLIAVFNNVANLLLRLIKVAPVDTVSSKQTPAELQLLLSQSHEHGVLPDTDHQILSGALKLENEKVADVMLPIAVAVTVPHTGTAADVERICRESGRSRLIVRDGAEFTGLAHVREALLSSGTGQIDRPITDFAQPIARVSHDLPLIDAVSALRAHRGQLALVTDEAGEVVGLTSMEDLVEQILGEFNDETDEATL